MVQRRPCLWGRLTLTALYAVALLVIAVVSSAHGSVHGVGYAGGEPIVGCHHMGRNGEAPAPAQTSCCDACTLTFAPGLTQDVVWVFIDRAEVSDRLGFATRLGANLDESPADLRSRAPPSPI
jgi:hypothetical protein